LGAAVVEAALDNVLRLVLALVVVAVAALKSQISSSRHPNLAQLKPTQLPQVALRELVSPRSPVKLMGGKEAQPHSRLAEAQQRCLHSAAAAVV
jgi:hypothetical protein